MRKLVVFLIFFSLTSSLKGQIVGDTEFSDGLKTSFSNTRDQADFHFEHLSFAKAVELYQVALIEFKTPEIKLKIAESYRKLNKPQESEQWYAQIINDKSVAEPIDMLYYAQALSANGKYDEARFWYLKYQASQPLDQRAQRKIEGIDRLNDFLSDSSRYSIEPFLFNSEESEFSPSFYKNGIVYVSNAESSVLTNNIFSWNQKNYYDLFESTRDQNGALTAPVKISSLSSKYHEGPSVFFNQDQEIIFTRSNFQGGKTSASADEVVKLKLYHARRVVKANQWEGTQELPFNSNEYSVGHPAINAEGTKLYFASDMPGGMGGTDIYQTELINGSWSTPENLGPSVNSEGNEMFPFLLGSNVLYFASDGLGGLGGHDIYQADLDIARPPVNLGYPLNSRFDDFGLILDPSGGTGFFTSNRDSGVGDDDIYTIIVHKVDLKILVEGEELKGLNPSEIAVVDIATGNEVPFKLEENQIHVEGTHGKEYEIHLNKQGYARQSQLISAVPLPDGAPRHSTIRVEPISTSPELDISKDVTSTKIILIENMAGETQSFYLSENGLNPYQGNEEDLQHLLAERRVSVEGIERISNIYYGLDKFHITGEAEQQLLKIGSLLNKYTDLVLQLDSYADSRASKDYNRSLAARRSQSVVDYLTKAGVSNKRINSASHGENNLVNECGDGVKCPEEKHQVNRRTEFRILIDKRLIDKAD